MPQTHELVHREVLRVMGDRNSGLNFQLAAVLNAYQIRDALAIDWQSKESVAYCVTRDSAYIRLSTLTGRLVLVTVPQGTQWTGETRGVKWSGRADLLLLFQLRYSIDTEGGLPDDDTITRTATALEDAVGEVFQVPTIRWDPQVIYAKPPDCAEGYYLEPLEDGAAITIPISVGFKVDARQ